MKRVAIIGGETHIGEITSLAGERLEIVGAVVRPEQAEEAAEQFGCPIFKDAFSLYEEAAPEIVAIANENDLKAAAVMQALSAGCDVVVDKPLCLTLAEQDAIEQFLAERPQRRLLNLLTLRGRPEWMALRDVVRGGEIGSTAFIHVRMAVRLKRDQRPPWFLDCRRSGGLFLDLLIHGIDQVEWLSGNRITGLTARTGNIGFPLEETLRDHASVYCELDNGGTAVVEGQRMLPDTVGSDYRVTVAATGGVADLRMGADCVVVSSPEAADECVTNLPDPVQVVGDWLDGAGAVIPQEASLRANRLAVLATVSAQQQRRIAL